MSEYFYVNFEHQVAMKHSSNGILTTIHSVEIGPLIPNTLYHYQVRSADSGSYESSAMTVPSPLEMRTVDDLPLL